MTVGELSDLYLKVENDKYWYSNEELYDSVVEAVRLGYYRILNTRSPDKLMSAYNFWSYLDCKLREREDYTPEFRKVSDSFDTDDYKFIPLYKEISKFRAVCIVVIRDLIMPVFLCVLCYSLGYAFPRFAIIMALLTVALAINCLGSIVMLFRLFNCDDYGIYKSNNIDYDVIEDKFYKYRKVTPAYKNMVALRDRVLICICQQCGVNFETRLNPCHECKLDIHRFFSPAKGKDSINDFELCRFERKFFSKWYENA